MEYFFPDSLLTNKRGLKQNRGKSRRYVFRPTLQQVRKKKWLSCLRRRPPTPKYTSTTICCLDKKKKTINKAIHSLLNI